MKTSRLRGLPLISSVVLLAGAAAELPVSPDGESDEPAKLIAAIHPLSGTNVKGTVVFEREGSQVRITAKVGGLYPHQEHGIHLHRFGDLGSDDGSGLGAHFNPPASTHNPADPEKPSAGKLGHLKADEKGNATLVVMVDHVSLGHGKTGILGRAVAIDAGGDDGSGASGDVADRMAAGVIGIARDAVPEEGNNETDRKKEAGKPE